MDPSYRVLTFEKVNNSAADLAALQDCPQDALSFSRSRAHEVPLCCCSLQPGSCVSSGRFSRMYGGSVRPLVQADRVVCVDVIYSER
eukprot:2845884-Rhodomonas_salina.1